MEISIQELLTVILIAFGLFLGFRLTYMLIFKFVSRTQVKGQLFKLGPVLEGISWLVFIVWAVQFLIDSQHTASLSTLLVLMVFFVGIVWFVLRDFVSGILLRLENSINLNERLQIKDMKGSISKIGYLSLELVNDQGQTIRLPYSTVQTNVRLKDNPSKRIKAHQFELVAPKIEDVDTLMNKYAVLLHTSPWSSVTKSPEIKFLKETTGQYHFLVVIYTLQVAYFQKVKQYLTTHTKGTSFVENSKTD